MKLCPHSVPDWPKLAWVARLARRSDNIIVYHGPLVETGESWCAEAVWAGHYADGDFDRTDLVFGSGIRCREGHAVFVSSGTTLDRLWYQSNGDIVHIANSLPALLTVAEVSVHEIGGSPISDLETIAKGVCGYKRQLTCRRGSLGLVYFSNLRWDGQNLEEVDKPDVAPVFDRFETYAAYLFSNAEKLAMNLGDPARTHKIASLATVSKGYDSSAAAAVARAAGCRNAVTIVQATSFWRGSDSGADVARYLGMDCRSYDRTAENYPLEETIWAVAGRAGVLNWTLFDCPEPLCLLFTAPYGDKIWSRDRWQYADPYEFTDLSLGGIGEFRLFRGIFHCPVPFWGMRHLDEMWAITASPDMKPWSIGGSYDRPIPRRIVEEAGVPRSVFGQRKKNTSLDEAFLWPHSPGAAEGFRRFLSEQGLPAPARSHIGLKRSVARLLHLCEANLPRVMTRSTRRRRKERMSFSAELLFRWGNTELARVYGDGLATYRSFGSEQAAQQGK